MGECHGTGRAGLAVRDQSRSRKSEEWEISESLLRFLIFSELVHIQYYYTTLLLQQQQYGLTILLPYTNDIYHTQISYLSSTVILLYVS